MLSSLEEHYSQLLCLTDDWSVVNGTSLRRKQLIVKSLFILSKKKNDILKVAANDNRDSFTNIAFKNHMPSYLNQARNTNTFKYLQLKEVPFWSVVSVDLDPSGLKVSISLAFKSWIGNQWLHNNRGRTGIIKFYVPRITITYQGKSA